MDEKKTTEEEIQKTPKEDTEKDIGEGGKSETDDKIEQLNADTERINKAIAENENAKARQKLSGTAEAGLKPTKEKELTDIEYANQQFSGS